MFDHLVSLAAEVKDENKRKESECRPFVEISSVLGEFNCRECKSFSKLNTLDIAIL